LPLRTQDCDGSGQDDLVDLLAGAATDFNHNGRPDACEPLGDLDCGGSMTFADVNPSITALEGRETYEARHPDCPWLNADINGDGNINYADINPYIQLLSRL
jgi:hypothetical protein